MKHWILTRDRLNTFVTGLDLGHITLSYAKTFFAAYGVEIKANTKAGFIKKLAQLVRENEQ